VNIYQDLMYHGQPTNIDFWARTAITAILVFIIGYFVFRHYSPRFGEEI
jgi:ABC-type polysaccharide/polyol phosphate export permease